MKPFSLVFTFFRSLSLAHLERSLFSLSKQTVKPDEFILFVNDTEDFSAEEIVSVAAKHFNIRPSSFRFEFDYHDDPSKRNASYAQNKSIQMASHDLFINVKADMIYAPNFCEKVLSLKTNNPLEFIAPWCYQMGYFSETGKPHEDVNHAKDLEPLNWRENVFNLNKHTLNGQLHPHAKTDAPSFCTTKQAMELAGWFDENLREWSYWMLDLQGYMSRRGVTMIEIPEVLSWHMNHPIPKEEGERDLKRAHAHWLASPRRNDPNFQ